MSNTRRRIRESRGNKVSNIHNKSSKPTRNSKLQMANRSAKNIKRESDKQSKNKNVGTKDTTKSPDEGIFSSIINFFSSFQ